MSLHALLASTVYNLSRFRELFKVAVWFTLMSPYTKGLRTLTFILLKSLPETKGPAILIVTSESGFKICSVSRKLYGFNTLRPTQRYKKEQ